MVILLNIIILIFIIIIIDLLRHQSDLFFTPGNIIYNDLQWRDIFGDQRFSNSITPPLAFWQRFKYWLILQLLNVRSGQFSLLECQLLWMMNWKKTCQNWVGETMWQSFSPLHLRESAVVFQPASNISMLSAMNLLEGQKPRLLQGKCTLVIWHVELITIKL